MGINNSSIVSKNNASDSEKGTVPDGSGIGSYFVDVDELGITLCIVVRHNSFWALATFHARPNQRFGVLQIGFVSPHCQDARQFIASGVFRAGQQLTDCWQNGVRNGDHRLSLLLADRSLIFRDLFLVAESIVVGDQFLDSLFIPSGRIMLFSHLFRFRRMRRRYACSDLPLNS
jgi:hypothetical protein